MPFAVRIVLVASLATFLPAQWGAVLTPVAPTEITSAPMTYDFVNSRSLLLHRSQLWAFDGSTWAHVPSVTQPTGLPGTSLEFNLLTGTALLYGGIPPSSMSTPNVDETWIWNGTDWSQAAPSLTPSGLARYGLTTDILRNRFVLYGGIHNIYQDSTISGTTWEFDGTTWTASGASGPGPRERLSMCYSLALGRTVLFGGGGPPPASNGQPTTDDDTWLYDGSQWQVAPVTGVRPRPRVDACMVYDQVRQVCILVGGQHPVTMEVYDETWEFDGTAWRQVSRSASPPRTRASMCYDIARARPVLFGGRTASTALLGDTWEFAANHRLYGLGCLGTFGRPTLQRGLPPRLGRTGSVVMTNLDPTAGLAVFTYGFSASQWAFGSLPASLAFLGMPGCVAYASADELVLAAAANGQSTWTFTLPNDPLLFGLQVYTQGISFDPTRNAAGLVSSNGDILTLGW